MTPKPRGKKKEYKIGDILIDDCDLIYRVIEVFKNSAVVEPFPNKQNLSTEIMSFESMKNEGWKVANLSKLNI